MQNLLHQVPQETPPLNPKTHTVVQKTPVRWVMLLVCFVSYGAAGVILVYIPPSQVQDLVLLGSYFPLVLALGIGNLSLSTYLFKNTLLGLACAATGSLLLLLRLHQTLTWWLAVACFAPIVFTKLLLTFQKHKR